MFEVDVDELFNDASPRLVNRWKAWNEKNPHIYAEFKDRAFELYRAGAKRSSAWLIINRIRWDYTIRTKGEVFKIGNDYIALFARRLIQEHPEMKDFFKLKKMKKNRILYGEYIDAEGIHVR